MEKLKLERPCDEVKELMLEIAPELCGEDLNYNDGNEDQLIETVAKKMNRSFGQAKNWIESVSHTSGKAS